MKYLIKRIKEIYKHARNIIVSVKFSRKKPNLIDIKDEHGRCPIHCAAIFANVEAVKVLLKANSNPNQVMVHIQSLHTL